MRSLTFASQVNRPRVNNLIPLGDIKTIKLVDGGLMDLPISKSRDGNIIVIFILLLFHNFEFNESMQG